MKRYIRSVSSYERLVEDPGEVTLHFRYPEEYTDKAEQLVALLDSKGFRYNYYPEGSYGHEFFIGRAPGYTWNDIMRLVNSVKSAKYDKVKRILD